MMRKKKSINLGMWAILSVMFVACMAACKNDDDKGSGKDYMKAKIDGRSWEAAKDNMILSDTKTGYLFISGARDGDEEIITIQMFDFPMKTGTYPLGTGEYDTHCFYTPNDQVSYILFDDIAETTGSLTITKYNDDRVEGKFSFTAMTSNEDDLVRITDGSFSMPSFRMPQ